MERLLKLKVMFLISVFLHILYLKNFSSVEIVDVSVDDMPILLSCWIIHYLSISSLNGNNTYA